MNQNQTSTPLIEILLKHVDPSGQSSIIFLAEGLPILEMSSAKLRTRPHASPVVTRASIDSLLT